MLDNGTTTPTSSSNFHYDNPRFLCYDVPRSSIRSRQNSESMSTLGGSPAEIKNPVYVTKRRSESKEREREGFCACSDSYVRMIEQGG